MINVRLNGRDEQVPPAHTVRAVVAGLTGKAVLDTGLAADGSRLGVAVALNAGIVPRSSWASTVLTDGDDLEIVTAVQGG
jgi:sulfur carrier protein